MSKIKRKKISILSKLRNYFIAGILILVPIGFTLYLTIFIISISSNLIPKEINPNYYLPFSIPGLEILISIIIITLVGGLSLSFIGRKILNMVNDLFKKIPILRTIYSAIGQMTQTFAPNKGKRKEMGIVLKRRDNAPIVKDVYGGLIDILMKSQDIPGAIAFVKKCLQDMVWSIYGIIMSTLLLLDLKH